MGYNLCILCVPPIPIPISPHLCNQKLFFFQHLNGHHFAYLDASSSLFSAVTICDQAIPSSFPLSSQSSPTGTVKSTVRHALLRHLRRCCGPRRPGHHHPVGTVGVHLSVNNKISCYFYICVVLAIALFDEFVRSRTARSLCLPHMGSAMPE